MIREKRRERKKKKKKRNEKKKEGKEKEDHRYGCYELCMEFEYGSLVFLYGLL